MRANMTPPDLRQTPLYDLSAANGANFVPFAGYELAAHYELGVLKEHLHTRAAVGLFDVGHMGQIAVRSDDGVAAAALALESLLPVDVAGLRPGRQRYAMLTNADGGVLDDLMVAHRGDHLQLVVNAACTEDDFAHLQAQIGADCEVSWLNDRSLIALQGPKAEAVLAAHAPDVTEMRFMDVRDVMLAGAACVVSRSGYTGEDGFEISMPVESAVAVAELLAGHEAVAWVGLGARDSLRLESGLCLYGSDLDISTTPVEAGLAWAIQRTRRRDGARAGGFPGADVILAQLDDGPARRRVGLLPEGRAPMRDGTALFATPDAEAPVGHVSSGGFGPSVGGPIAMGYVPTTLARVSTLLFGDVRGKRLPVKVTALPFVSQGYKR